MEKTNTIANSVKPLLSSALVGVFSSVVANTMTGLT